MRSGRTLPHMRVVALLFVALCAGPAAAARRAFMHIGAEVVSSARLVAMASSGAVALSSRSFGSRGAAVLVEQHSGAAVHLRDGSVVPRPGQAALVLSGGAEHRLAFVPATGSAELMVTLFPDGAPPPVRN